MQTNNKLREALETLLNLAYEVQDANSECGPTTCIPAQFIIDTVKSALAEPVKNYEVGTAEEQQARHCAWCREHGIDGDNKVNCAHPDISCDLCALRWAQMPYKEGGDK